jgi:aspartate dehydrogenase
MSTDLSAQGCADVRHPAATRKRRVGIVGAGSLGQYLIHAISHDPKASSELEIAFVWNRSSAKLQALAAEEQLPRSLLCDDLAHVAEYRADVIVEVCHPDISKRWGAAFLATADYYCGSPTALADAATDAALRAAAAAGAANPSGHGLYIPAGALWGAVDLAKLSARGGLASLAITMKKHPASLKLEGALGERVAALLADGTPGETVIFDGPVRELAPLAPNNVNTMAAAAVAAANLGFDGVRAVLISDPGLLAHVVTVDARGRPGPDGQAFRVFTERYNPAPPGAITGAATYASFLSSLLATGGRGAGVHMC